LQEQLEALRCVDLEPFLPTAHPAEEPGVAFVLGLPRSGTTLLEQMLDLNHRAIRYESLVA
jgi:hypothetical protein